VTALINELAAGPDAGQTLLVLDDYHLIDSAAVHSSLGFLLEHRPQGLHLMLASRSDPPLALARLRARGQLAELRAAELRFTADEAAALLRFDELYFLRGEGRTIQRWLSGLSADLVRTRPRLLLAQALLAAGAGRIETMEPLVEQLTSRELEVLQMLAAGSRTRPSRANSWSPSIR